MQPCEYAMLQRDGLTPLVIWCSLASVVDMFNTRYWRVNIVNE